MHLQSVPVVDLNDFTAGDESTVQTFVHTIGIALEEIGFFTIVNHGIDAELILQAYAVAEAFFHLPEEVKLRYEKRQLKGQRGFTRFGQEHAKDSATPDLKEFWHLGRDLPLQHPLAAKYPPNLHPSEVPAFHPILAKLYTQLDLCAAQLLEACALYLSEPRSLLREMVRDGDSILRVIHYPPLPLEGDPDRLRAAPHEDINLITLLCEATADGLELLQQDGSWLSVPVLPGQIIVDGGDMLQQITNGLFKSTTHRVVNPNNDRDRRFSMPFFAHPRPEIDLSPLPKCVARTGGQAKFPAISAGEYLTQRLQEIGLAI
ncbi:MAG: isopenicillin N synthase family oxygenase [Scytolyngbya sp. HA4215-MV1]|jgi:isopenicillin N synthase-like dioxygenase|nr:isopenicillin N synthase family oxygenase [Scytolyngbya sp. HA4215-MV1]